MFFKCWKSLGKIFFFVYNDFEVDDKKIVLQLLLNIDIKYLKIIIENKGKDIDIFIFEFMNVKEYKVFGE